MRRVLSVILSASTAVALVACSHETLDSGTEGITVTYTPDPTGTGRYERGPFGIGRVTVFPTDPAAVEILDPVTDTLILRFDNFGQTEGCDLIATSPVLFSKVALPQGDYEVSTFRITTPALVDTDVPANPATCIEGVAVLNSGSAPGVPSSVEFTNAPEFNFTIHPGQTSLAIKVNVPGLIAGYESAFTCQLGCGPGGGPCLTAFNVATYRAAILANVSFE
jgi:hypothetical protein